MEVFYDNVAKVFKIDKEFKIPTYIVRIVWLNSALRGSDEFARIT